MDTLILMELRVEYPIYGAADIQYEQVMLHIMRMHNLTPDTPVSVLPFVGMIGKEIRHLYFQQALDENNLFRTNSELTKIPDGEKVLHHLQVTRLFSFGECNALCPYCKRDMQFIDDNGNVLANTTTPLINLFRMAEGAVLRGEVVRFSGGDPVLFPKVCYAIGQYVEAIGGKGVSIAHNGSGPGFVRNLLPLMSSAAIDIKAHPRYIHTVLGLSEREGINHFNNSLKTQRLFHNPLTNPNGAVLDVRTPVFGPHDDPTVPQTTVNDMLDLGSYITENNDPTRTFWTWRMYKEVKGCNWTPPNLQATLDMMEIVSKKYPQQWMGIRAKWHGGGMLYFHNGKCVNPSKVSDKEHAGSGNSGEALLEV